MRFTIGMAIPERDVDVALTKEERVAMMRAAEMYIL